MQDMQIQERRQRMSDTISQLIEKRQQVMVAFNTLAALKPFRQLDPAKRELQNFCELMVDYTALGHFEIYQRIIEGKERRQPVKSIAEEAYPTLAETTDVLVDFNDKYETVEELGDVAELGADLSKLGEAFAVRIELEDKILEALNC